jgi:hypothetical protein
MIGRRRGVPCHPRHPARRRTSRAARSGLATVGVLLLLLHTLQAVVVVPCLCAMAPESMARAHESHASHGPVAAPRAHDGHGGHAPEGAAPPATDGEPEACEHGDGVTCPRCRGTASRGHGSSVCGCNDAARGVIAAILGAVGIPRAPVAIDATLRTAGTVHPAISPALSADLPPLNPPPRA